MVDQRTKDARRDAVYKAGLGWLSEIKTLGQMREAEMRAAQERIDKETRRRKELVARAIYDAFRLGASKAALQQVTTTDRASFEKYVQLGKELAGE